MLDMRKGPQAEEYGLLAVCILFLFGFSSIAGESAYPPPPDFDSMPVDQKKREFFAYLSPMISSVNFELAAARDRVREIRDKLSQGMDLGWFEERWLRRLALRLEVDLAGLEDQQALETLERRAGVVPESLVLVQAAVESGWGSSRFAVEGNNYFGQRCYSANCGMVPTERADGQRFGLAEYASPADSIESYILNLNTHESYLDFRLRREELRNAAQPITGLSLVDGLESYSERGDEYVDQIRSMIRSNNLE